MNKVLTSIGYKKGLLIAISIAVLLIAAPRIKNLVQAEINCSGAPTVPTMNPFPKTVTSEPCKDFATVWAVKNGVMPNSVAEGTNITARAGDVLTVRAYAHNGAARGSAPATNVHVRVTVNDLVEPEHVIGATVTSDNAGGATGALSVHTASNERLEIVSAEVKDWYGNSSGIATVGYTDEPVVDAHFNQMDACFEFSKFVVITVRVVAVNTPTPPPVSQTSSLNAVTTDQICSEGIFNGRVTWDTTGYNEVVVKVRDITLGGSEVVMAAWPDGNQETRWLEPNHTYEFILYGNGNVIQRKQLAVGSLNCGTTPPPQATSSLTVTQGNRITGQCLYTGRVQWSTTNVDNVVVKVRDITGNSAENVMAAWEHGDQETPWLTPSHTYEFNLYGNGQLLQRKTLAVSSLDCSSPAPQITSSLEVSQGARINGQCLYTGHVTWSTNATGQVQLKVKDVTSNSIENLMAAWPTGSENTPWLTPSHRYQFTLYNDGSILQQKFLNVSALDCSTPPPPAPTCPSGSVVVSPSVINVGQNATISAPAGFTSGSFVSNDTSKVSVTGSTARGIAAGSATISGSGFTASNGATNCSLGGVTVVVNQPAPDVLSCQLISSNFVNVNDLVSVRASGGSGTYAFNAAGGNPATGAASSNNTFSTRYSTAGDRSINVISGSQVANCPVVSVRTPVVVCVPNTNVSLTRSAITQISGTNSYRTTISYSFSGQNQMKVTYINPDNGQEVVFAENITTSGSKEFTNFNPNKSYVFRIHDMSTCGGVVTTLIVRVDVNDTCVSNTHAAVNITSPIKVGSTYTVTVNWSSVGSHNIKLAHNSTTNIVSTGPSSSSYIASGLAAGSSHTFYAIDALCGDILAAATVIIPGEPIVVPPPTPTPPPVVNNCTGISCNTNVNNNTVTGNNNNTVNNNTNINGNNNVVNNVNTCVNNSCNVVYINQAGNVVPHSEFRQLAITKLVRNVNGGSFSNSANANQNDTVEYEVTVRNSGNAVINNVRFWDNMPSGLSLVSGNTNQSIGTLGVNESRRINYTARVNTSSGNSIQNTAYAQGDLAGQVQDDAWVFTQGVVQGGSVNLTYSKKAWNDTRNTDATTVVAAREEYITYTLTVHNSGNSPANSFVITDDLSSVLPYADVVDNGGGSVSGNVITFPSINIPAGGSVSKSFKVRVKFHLASNLSYVMTNTYGNTVTIRINTPQVLGTFTAPKTGANTAAFTFSTAFTALAFAVKRRKEIMQLIFT